MPVMSKVEAAFCRSGPWRGFARRAALPWGLREVPVGPRVLEIGGGSGAMAAALLDRDPAFQLTVTDLDPAMVAATAQRLAPYRERACVVVADATALDFEDGSFDTVCSWLMLHHTLLWEQVVAETVRVLRPGGLLVGYDLVDTIAARLVHRLDRSHARLVPPSKMRSVLGELDVVSPRVDVRLGGLMQRFIAEKAGTVPAATETGSVDQEAVRDTADGPPSCPAS